MGTGAALYEFQLSVPDGSYRLEVMAQSTNRIALQNDTSPAPALALQENLSVANLDFVEGGIGTGYALNTVGGTLYMGSDAHADYSGLVIWISILSATTNSTPPAGNWNITVVMPGLSSPISFVYPAHYSHYSYWSYDAIPKSGTYTVTASSGAVSLTKNFTMPDISAKLPLVENVNVTPTTEGGATVSWSPITGAKSYYVNLWTCVGGVNTLTGCNGGTYTEIAGYWVNTASASIPDGKLIKDVIYDVYVTASTVDMTTMKTVPPPNPGTQVNMSDNSFEPIMFTAL